MSPRFLFTVCLGFLCAVSVPSRCGAEMLKWSSKYTPDFHEVRDAAYGDGVYVVVGDNNTILYSTDAKNWQPGSLPPGVSCDLKAAVYCFGQFFASGSSSSGQGVIFGSMDGVSWTDITDEFLSTADEEAVDFPALSAGKIGGVDYVAVVIRRSGGWGDAIGLTSNGSVWRSSGYGYLFYSFFVALDGQMHVLGSSGDYWYWNAVGVGSYGDPNLQTSYAYSDKLRAYAAGNSTYVGVGDRRQLGFTTAGTSGVTFATSPAISDYKAVAFGRDTFVAVGTKGAVVVSFDLGRSWKNVTGLGLQDVAVNGIRYVGGKFIAYGGGRIITGEPVNKREWAAADLPSGAEPMNKLACNDQRIVAVGQKGQILYSATGTSWSKSAPATSRDLRSVVWDARSKAFYATGDDGTLLRSANGVKWSVVKTPGSGYFDGVARVGSRLIIAGGAKGKFLQSTDGKKWTLGNQSLINFSGRVVGDGNAAYMFGPAGKFLVKRAKSKNWSSVGGASSAITDLAAANKKIFAAGENGKLFSTSQAKPGKWDTIDTRTSGGLNGIAPSASAVRQLTAVGKYGLVYSQPGNGRWRLEMLSQGKPELQSVIRFKNRWIVAGSSGGSAYIAFTEEN